MSEISDVTQHVLSASSDAPTRARWRSRHTWFFLGLIALLVLLFEVLRAGMIWMNIASAQGADKRELLSSFLYGLRFDLATACYVALPVVIVGHLPWVGLRHSARLRKIFLGVTTAAMAIIIFVLIAEFEFFHEFQTRYNQLAFKYFDQPKTVVGMIWYNYPVWKYALLCIALTLAFLLGVHWLMRRTLGTPTVENAAVEPGFEAIAMTLLIVGVVIGMRGGLQSEPLRWGNAYHSCNEFVNQMSLNGLFALGQSGIDSLRHARSSSWMRRVPLDAAREVVRKLVVEPGETLVDPQHSTVLRQRTGPGSNTIKLVQPAGVAAARPANVVLVVMESFSARFVGACGSSPAKTPRFDELAREGVLFDHAFSGGTHTHQGVFCSLLGFPNLPGFEYLMENMVSNQPFLSLPEILRRRGYQTMFLYNGNLDWDNMIGFFRKQGMEKFIGSPDFPNPIMRDRVWGVTDQDVFDRANEEFEAADAKGSPFFGLVLTLSNHAPFDLPPLAFERTSDMGELNKRIDGVRYADWCVGRFIDEAKKRKYFANTLFVFVGDHGFHVPPRLTDAHVLFHHVPLLFYSPLLSEKGLVRHEAASQINIVPTILGLLDVPGPQATWARNLFSGAFRAGDDNFAIFKGSGGSGSDQAIAIVRGDKLLVVGAEGGTSLYRYTLNPTPAIEPLTDPALSDTRDEMRRIVDAYVASAMTDVTTLRAGPTERRDAPADGAAGAEPRELLH